MPRSVAFSVVVLIAGLFALTMVALSPGQSGRPITAPSSVEGPACRGKVFAPQVKLYVGDAPTVLMKDGKLFAK